MFKLSPPIGLLKLGLLLTAYCGLSLVLFFLASNTIIGWIIYFVLLLPFYGLVLLGGWIFVWINRRRTARLSWLWALVLALQVAVLLTSPGNCYGSKQGDRCYSNLQVLFGNVARTGYHDVPHWRLAEDAFPGLVAAYDASMILALWRVAATRSQ